MVRLRFGLGFLAGIITAGTIAVGQIPNAVAKAIISPQAIEQTAKSVTVQLLGYVPRDGGSQFGSGVLVSKKGNSYAVLTNRHVICALTVGGQCDRSIRLQIRTADGKLHPVEGIYTFESATGVPDFSLVFFQSTTNYPVATLGTTNHLKQHDLIWINGYLGRNDIKAGQEPFDFHKGFVSNPSVDPHGEGYTFKFSSIGGPGMSGSPLFDASGRVIGIFGQTGETGFLAGIPVDTILNTVNRQPTPRDRLNLSIDLTPLTGERPQLKAPQTADDYYLSGVMELEKQNPRGAIADLTQAIRLNPKLMIAYRHRAAIRATLGDRHGAMDDFQHVLKLTGDPTDAFDARARLRLQWDDYQGAIRDWTEAIKLEPNGTTFLFNRAMTYSLIENYPAAIRDFTSGIEIQPTDAMAYRERGRSYLGMNNLPAALQDLNRSIELDSNSTVAYDLRGYIQLSMGNYRAAVEDCTQAIRLEPENALAYSDRGFAWLMLGETQKAFKDTSEAIRLNPQLTSAYTARAMISERQGNFQSAIADSETVVRLLKQRGLDKSKSYQTALETIARLRSKVRPGSTSRSR
jgi:tetratricopeptide (TPR) repeat protein/S1-C subfamily serine protease